MGTKIIIPADTKMARDENGRYFPVADDDPRAVARLRDTLAVINGMVYSAGKPLCPPPPFITLCDLLTPPARG